MDIDDLLAKARAGDDAAERALLLQAAEGSFEAQKALLEGLLSNFFAGETPLWESATQCEVLARLVALRGDLDHRRVLAGVLNVRALECRRLGRIAEADAYHVETLTILDALADAGHPTAAAEVAIFAEGICSPAALEEARRVKKPLATPRADEGAPLLPWLRDWSTSTGSDAVDPDPLADWPEPTKGERIKAYFIELGWAFRTLGWSIQSVGQDLLHLGKTAIGRD